MGKEQMKELVVLGISGSPRKQGNTSLMVQRALEGARKVEGVQTEFIDLSKMKIQNCLGCEACRRQKALCVAIKDDMEKIYPLLLRCDALVLGSPVYFGGCHRFNESRDGSDHLLGGDPCGKSPVFLKMEGRRRDRSGRSPVWRARIYPENHT